MSKFLDVWLRMRASYWFLPSLMAITAILAAVGLVRFDSVLDSERLREFGWLYINQPAGAQALLSTIAGSMITVAGVTFSITLLAVSHATAQIGPGLLAGFMRDRGNQITLGTFIATFLYCLMVLRTIHAGVDGDSGNTISPFVPHMAVIGALLLAIFSVMVLIYFIHHVPQSINVANVVAHLGHELVENVDKLYPHSMGGRRDPETDRANLPPDIESQWPSVSVGGHGGYLRVIDSDTLIGVAKKHDLVLRLGKRPGEFGLCDEPLLWVSPGTPVDDELTESLRSGFAWGSDRTPEQDILRIAEQLVEIAGKALSPGINNQHTATLCINQFERALLAMLQKDLPDPRRYDDEQNLRIIAEAVDHQTFLDTIINPMRQYVRGDWIATDHLLRSLKRLMQLEPLRSSRDLLAGAVSIIQTEAQASTMSVAQKKMIAAI